jgi:amino acid adenylation domain-containing protein
VSGAAPETRAVLPDLATPLLEEDFAPVATLVEAWARREPGTPALTRGGQTLSYAELSGRARAVARTLAAGGVRPGDVVALDGRPGFGLIAGLLGILLAGGVVVMIDRRLPLERRRLMCRESGAQHFVRLRGEGEPDAWWSEHIRGTVVAVDLEAGDVIGAPPAAVTNDLPRIEGNDGAYIFFTSGTTGVPKAVLGTHRGLGHFVAWQRTTFGVGPGDRSSQLTGLSFDVVLREIFLPLTSGATLCFPDDPDELGPERVLPWLEREGITILHTVPALAGTWLLAPPPGVSLPKLRRIFFAGEPLSGHLVRRWRETFGTSAEIVNLYGPTETTLAKCFYVVPPEPGEGVQPVGWPLPQSQALVIADGHHPCGVGEWGEIVIRTPYRTRGYANSPEETRKRFRPNPQRPDGQDLLYYTGDRGRFRADGALEISGRLDDQLKISGARVEPGEIVTALGRSPKVRQSVVLGRKNSLGDVSLAAYVVPAEGASPTPAELKAFLEARLPPYMVPSSFLLLERLPLTANGKVDRQALSRMDADARASRAERAAPRTAIERTLARIWAEVLALDRVGIEDNFFDLGGQSLLLMQVVTRARGEGFDLTPLTMLRYPTVKALAHHLSGEGSAPPSYEAVRERAQRQRAALARQRRPLGRS